MRIVFGFRFCITAGENIWSLLLVFMNEERTKNECFSENAFKKSYIIATKLQKFPSVRQDRFKNSDRIQIGFEGPCLTSRRPVYH